MANGQGDLNKLRGFVSFVFPVAEHRFEGVQGESPAWLHMS